MLKVVNVFDYACTLQDTRSTKTQILIYIGYFSVLSSSMR